MTDKSAGFIETLLTRTDAIAVEFSRAITNAAMTSIERATSERRWPLDHEALRSAINAGISRYLSGEIDAWRLRKSFSWRYDLKRRLLHVSSLNLNLGSLSGFIRRGVLPNEVEVVVYETPTAVFLITGRFLRGWLDGRLEDVGHGC